MALRVVRLGSARAAREGLRIGTVRRPPRGVKKRDYAKLDYYDAWLPDLAPSPGLIRTALADWKRFARLYRREMREREHLIALLATLSHSADFSIGCYCEDERRCHRSVLRELLAERGAKIGR
jgi:uncharacterized protein YeaO (DUF488 family)